MNRRVLQQQQHESNWEEEGKRRKGGEKGTTWEKREQLDLLKLNWVKRAGAIESAWPERSQCCDAQCCGPPLFVTFTDREGKWGHS
jgi:hypothetical protein